MTRTRCAMATDSIAGLKHPISLGFRLAAGRRLIRSCARDVGGGRPRFSAGGKDEP